MKNFYSFLFICMFTFTYFIAPINANAKVMWGNTEVTKGIVGKVTFTKDTPMYKKDKNNKFIFVKKFKKSQTVTVLSSTKTHFLLTGNVYVEKSSDINYTAVPRNLIDLYNVENRKITSGLKLNKEKSYTYYSFYTDVLDQWQYTGTETGMELWSVTFNKEMSNDYSFIENSSGMKGQFADAVAPMQIPYPLTINKKWRVTNALFDGSVEDFTVASTTRKIEVNAGIFTNVIAIVAKFKDEYGNDAKYHYYYAQGVGHILTVDATEKPAVRLKELFILE